MPRVSIARQKLDEARFFYEKMWRGNNPEAHYYFSALVAAGRSMRDYAVTEINEWRPTKQLRRWVASQPTLQKWLYPTANTNHAIIEFFRDWRNVVAHLRADPRRPPRVGPTDQRLGYTPPPNVAPVFIADPWLVPDAQDWQPLNAKTGTWVFNDYPGMTKTPLGKGVFEGCQEYLLLLRKLLDEFEQGPA